MSETPSTFSLFSKPFIDALIDTFKTMLNTDLSVHSPRVKLSSIAQGDITAMIGMNGQLRSQMSGEYEPFAGMLALTFKEELYVKLAGRMLMEDYSEYCEEISDAGSEICNIVMGNAKNGLSTLGFKIEMSTPTTVKGKNHQLKYPPKSTVIEITCTTVFGDFMLEICYQEFKM